MARTCPPPSSRPSTSPSCAARSRCAQTCRRPMHRGRAAAVLPAARRREAAPAARRSKARPWLRCPLTAGRAAAAQTTRTIRTATLPSPRQSARTGTACCSGRRPCRPTRPPWPRTASPYASATMERTRLAVPRRLLLRHPRRPRRTRATCFRLSPSRASARLRSCLRRRPTPPCSSASCRYAALAGRGCTIPALSTQRALLLASHRRALRTARRWLRSTASIRTSTRCARPPLPT